MILQLRLASEEVEPPLIDVDRIIRQGKAEADEFYTAIHPAAATAEEQCIQRQALAGMLWGKANLSIGTLNRWFEGDNPKFPAPNRASRCATSTGDI